MSFSNILVIVSPFPMSQTGSQPTAEGFRGQSKKLIFHYWKNYFAMILWRILWRYKTEVKIFWLKNFNYSLQHYAIDHRKDHLWSCQYLWYYHVYKSVHLQELCRNVWRGQTKCQTFSTPSRNINLQNLRLLKLSCKFHWLTPRAKICFDHTKIKSVCLFYTQIETEKIVMKHLNTQFIHAKLFKNSL